MEDAVRSARPVAAPADDLTDEEAARRARELYRDDGLPTIEPDDVVAAALADSERIHGWRPQAGLSRIDDTSRAVVRDDGPLYITNERLLHFGRQTTAVALADIGELAMADDRILVTIAGSRGLMLDVEWPRQFRVLLAAARGAGSR